MSQSTGGMLGGSSYSSPYGSSGSMYNRYGMGGGMGGGMYGGMGGGMYGGMGGGMYGGMGGGMYGNQGNQ